MLKQPNMKMIGIYVCLFAISVIGLFGYFLKTKLNPNETTVVMYFEESVKGLDVGAPVLFKGVKIGEVTQVKLKANLKDMHFSIVVYAVIYNGKSLVTNIDDEDKLLDKFIDSGLRAQLAVSSVITGQLLIELDMHPNTQITLHDAPSGYFEIPTILSPFAEISKTLKIMPVAKIAQDVNSITKTLNQDLPPLLKKMNKTFEDFDNILVENKDNTKNMVKEFGGAAKSLNSMVEENSQNISNAIQSFGEATMSLKNLTDYLQMYPNAIITGKEY